MLAVFLHFREQEAKLSGKTTNAKTYSYRSIKYRIQVIRTTEWYFHGETNILSLFILFLGLSFVSCWWYSALERLDFNISYCYIYQMSRNKTSFGFQRLHHFVCFVNGIRVIVSYTFLKKYSKKPNHLFISEFY